ncbi:MAG TPA: hypothetical protein VMT54_19165 [Candidatus Cybelea sp.]|nr:hypothetical protein [Candidatus Cybelea sp.]
MSSAEPVRPPKTGCWPVALIVVGALVALVSGLCVGGGFIGGIMDVTNGSTSIGTVLESLVGYLFISGGFLAGGIALILAGRRMIKRR